MWRFQTNLLLLSAAWVLATPRTLAVAQSNSTKGETTGFIHKTFTTMSGTESPYVVFVPHNYNRAKDVPVILFLHGAGSTKGDPSGKQPVDTGIGLRIKSNERTFPYLAIFPQAEERGWQNGENPEIVLGILDATLAEYDKADAARVYLTGLSMGGAGTWYFAAAHPDRWAAIVPICGGGNPENAETLRDIPCWAFHGAVDKIVPVAKSRQMVAALKAVGGNPKYTEYPKAGHTCWDQAYATTALWTWLSHQKKK